jgi:iron complex transport system permease protein
MGDPGGRAALDHIHLMTIAPVTPARTARVLLLAALALLLIFSLAPLAGPAPLDLRKAWAGEWPDAQVYFAVRWPRALLAGLAGGALATAGVLFQALLRDALATPFTLGVSSGASLGAVLAIVFGWQSVAGFPALWVAAFGGAAAVLAIVISISAEGRRLSSFTLLLSGVTINAIVMSAIMLLHSTATAGQSFAIVHWLMGGIEPLPYAALAVMAAVILPVTLGLCAYARHWNLLAVGEEWAATRGASPNRLLLGGYLAGSLLTASVTAVTGPIGFVGLLVPHALRLRLGGDHRLLMPASFLMGAAFLIVCDTAARTLFTVEIPVSVLTALVGGPFFIALLRGKKKSLWL